MSGGGGRRSPYLASRLQGLGTTIFAEMSALATATGSVNLGQGFPDTDGPEAISEAAVRALRGGRNQYPPGAGEPELRQAISEHRMRFYAQSFDPDTEVLVTAGATEAVTSAVIAFCETGDEVILIEPYYDSYPAAVAIAGARPRPVPLRPPGWSLDLDALADAVTPRTRMVIVNSPHNPTGRVLDEAELAALAELCVRHDLLAVTDEVYEHLVYEGRHVPLGCLPGMAERTVTISSAGKTFSFTGWKVGWVCGPAALVGAVRTVKQYLTYVSAAPLQPAVAVGLGLPDSYFTEAAASLRQRRDRLCAGLGQVGFTVSVPQAGYFTLAGIAALDGTGGDADADADGGFGAGDASRFCRELPGRVGVVAIPASAFCERRPDLAGTVRFAFCKRPEVLDEALLRLSGLHPGEPGWSSPPASDPLQDR
jgi:N-succinyldiaminopimelate aminotransferase